MLAKTLVVNSMCSLLTYILCTLCVFFQVTSISICQIKITIPYHTLPTFDMEVDIVVQVGWRGHYTLYVIADEI